MKKKIIVVGTTALILIIIFLLFNSHTSKESKVTFDTVTAKRGSISNIVTATGTLEAVKTVEVGTQVSGEISKIYVDFNSHVKAGQLLAELDRKPLLTTLNIARAALDNARAEVTYQTSNYNRLKALNDKKLVAESDYDLALYNYEQATTALKTAQSNYDKAKINLDYAYIYSPIDGVILNRAVDEGQTVAASFNTPTLFTIAQDLTHMQVEASVDEADIGQVKDGQRVEFNVDAYPDMDFDGTVTQIRLQPVVTSNVVTYTVIIKAANPEKKLMPGMTATITIYVAEAKNAILIPSKALRFSPDTMMLKAYFASIGEKGKLQLYQRKRSGNHANPNIKNNAGTENSQSGRVWIKNGNDVRPVRVTTGIDDEINVQIISGLKDSDQVVLAMTSPEEFKQSSSGGLANSPFMPRRPSRNKKSK